MTARTWTEAQRRAAAIRIRAQKPWLRSTGPRTPEGKASVACNAFKHGGRSRSARSLLSLLAEQRRFRLEVNAMLDRFKMRDALKIILPPARPALKTPPMPAFKPYTVRRPAAAAVSPLVFDSPHSGERLPGHFKYACERAEMSWLPDLHVDKLLAGLPARGFPVLEARIHRACIDLNRFEDELDPAEIKDGWSRPHRESVNTRKGFGLIPRDTLVKGEFKRVYNACSMPTQAEVEKRIGRYLRPYLAALTGLLDEARQAHGFYLHVNMHSMGRRVNPRSGDIVLGDVKGQACAPDITRFARDFFESQGLSVALNTPYAGGALVKQTAAPAEGRHSLQIELARDIYMNEDTLRLDKGKAAAIGNMLERFALELEQSCLANATALRPETRAGKSRFEKAGPV